MKIAKMPIIVVLAVIIALPLVSAQPQIIQYQTPDVEVYEHGVKVTFYLQNNGDAIPGDGYVYEVQARQTSPLSWVGSQSSCDPAYPQNKYRKVILNGAGDQVSFDITIIAPAGVYDLYLVSTDSCCNDNPSCQSVQPFGWGTFLKTVTITTGTEPECGNGQCEGDENPDTCPSDCHGYCGDGYCSNAERTSGSCPDECGSQEICGDGVCEGTETTVNCPSDCVNPNTCTTPKPTPSAWTQCANGQQSRTNYQCVGSQWASFVESQTCTMPNSCTNFNCPAPFYFCFQDSCQPNYVSILMAVGLIIIVVAFIWRWRAK